MKSRACGWAARAEIYIQSIVTSAKAQSPCTALGAGLGYCFPCHLPEGRDLISKERGIRHLAYVNIRRASFMKWCFMVALGVTRNHCFHKGEKSNRKLQLPLETIIISLPVLVRTFSGHCSFLILSVRETLVINLEILMKDYRVISALENCNVFKCLT